MDKQQLKTFMTPQSAGQQLGLSAARVRQLCDEGKLEAVQLDGSGLRLIDPASVDAYAAERRAQNNG